MYLVVVCGLGVSASSHRLLSGCLVKILDIFVICKHVFSCCIGD